MRHGFRIPNLCNVAEWREGQIPMQQKCPWIHCNYPVWEESATGRCLYHDSDNGRDEETALKVWEEAWRKCDAEDCNFAGWHFPPNAIGFRERKLSPANFELAKFVTIAMFYRAKFVGDVWFLEAEFSGDAWFQDAEFGGDAWFRGVRFGRDAWFHGARFGGRADFGGATFEEGYELRLETPTWDLPFVQPRPFSRREEGKTAYRLAKQAAQNAGNYAGMGKYHYAEQCAIEFGERKSYGWRFWRWCRKPRGVLGFARALVKCVFARGVFGYGEKPHRALVAGGLVIAVWTLLCYANSGIQHETFSAFGPTLKQSLYFSIVTFTTLGYGDFSPSPDFQMWAAAEALIGAALMAVFIVCLTRKYIR